MSPAALSFWTFLLRVQFKDPGEKFLFPKHPVRTKGGPHSLDLLLLPHEEAGGMKCVPRVEGKEGRLYLWGVLSALNIH